jgi:hypothetical protein
MIKLNISKDSEKVKDLTKLMVLASKDGESGRQAREAIAAFAGPVITQVLQQFATHRAFYTQYSYNFGEVPTIPLDNFTGNSEGLISIWSCSTPGGLATNHISGGDEFRMTTFPYDTALSMLKRNAEQGRFELLVSGLERMAQELMIKEAYQAWSTMLLSLGAARTNGSPHLISATTPNVFQLDDVNRLKTKVSRLRNSWLGGTPTQKVGQGFTHLVISPEIAEQIRGMAYNPQNVRAGSFTTSGATAIPLPDQIRMSIFNESGLLSIPGVANFVQLNEFGVGQAYNALFDNGYTAGGGEPAFASATDELILAVDLSLDAGVQMTASDSERSSQLKVEEDDQFTKRSGRFGYFASLETGYSWLDSKTLSGIIV